MAGLRPQRSGPISHCSTPSGLCGLTYPSPGCQIEMPSIRACWAAPVPPPASIISHMYRAQPAQLINSKNWWSEAGSRAWKWHKTLDAKTMRSCQGDVRKVTFNQVLGCFTCWRHARKVGANRGRCTLVPKARVREGCFWFFYIVCKYYLFILELCCLDFSFHFVKAHPSWVSACIGYYDCPGRRTEDGKKKLQFFLWL